MKKIFSNFTQTMVSACPPTPIAPLPPNLNGLKATFIAWPRKAPHRWKQMGFVVVHDINAQISFNEFDWRYRGKRSRFGKYIRELDANGVDVTSVVNKLEKLESDKEDVAMVI